MDTVLLIFSLLGHSQLSERGFILNHIFSSWLTPRRKGYGEKVWVRIDTLPTTNRKQSTKVRAWQRFYVPLQVTLLATCLFPPAYLVTAHLTMNLSMLCFGSRMLWFGSKGGTFGRILGVLYSSVDSTADDFIVHCIFKTLGTS